MASTYSVFRIDHNSDLYKIGPCIFSNLEDAIKKHDRVVPFDVVIFKTTVHGGKTIEQREVAFKSDGRDIWSFTL